MWLCKVMSCYQQGPLKMFIGFSRLYHNTKELSVTVGLLISSALNFGGRTLINQQQLSNQQYVSGDRFSVTLQRIRVSAMRGLFPV